MMNTQAVKLRKVFAGVVVDDLKAAGRWYEIVLGRSPDVSPMTGLLEWHLTGDAYLQVVDLKKVREVQQRPQWGKAGGSSVSFVVDKIDDQLAIFLDHNIPLVSKFTANSAFKTITVADPSGNLVTFVEQDFD